MRELYMSITTNKQRTTTITLTHRVKEIFAIAIAALLDEKKKGVMIRCPYGKGPSYMMHNSESAIHPMRRFFKQHYNINLLD
jgi:uncharacterized membrane-anchored protein